MTIRVSFEISYPILTLNSRTVEVWELISNFISHFTGHVIIYRCRDKRQFISALGKSLQYVWRVHFFDNFHGLKRKYSDFDENYTTGYTKVFILTTSVATGKEMSPNWPFWVIYISVCQSIKFETRLLWFCGMLHSTRPLRVCIFHEYCGSLFALWISMIELYISLTGGGVWIVVDFRSTDMVKSTTWL